MLGNRHAPLSPFNLVPLGWFSRVDIAVIGATGRTGRRVTERLCALGHRVTAIARDPARLATLDARARAVPADIFDVPALTAALADTPRIVSCVPALDGGVIRPALPPAMERLVAMGSVRRYLAQPDPEGKVIAIVERELHEVSPHVLVLHPSMIYGAPDDGTVSRIFDLVRRWPRHLPVVVPLPDWARRRVQPIHLDDVADAVTAAVLADPLPPSPLILAGPAAIPYARMIRSCARRLGRHAVILPLPTSALAAGAALLSRLGFRPPVNTDEIRRASEDKSFDIGPMRRLLGVDPKGFEEVLFSPRMDWVDARG